MCGSVYWTLPAVATTSQNPPSRQNHTMDFAFVQLFKAFKCIKLVARLADFSILLRSGGSNKPMERQNYSIADGLSVGNFLK